MEINSADYECGGRKIVHFVLAFVPSNALEKQKGSPKSNVIAMMGKHCDDGIYQSFSVLP